jgi:hypothetical protein
LSRIFRFFKGPFKEFQFSLRFSPAAQIGKVLYFILISQVRTMRHDWAIIDRNLPSRCGSVNLLPSLGVVDMALSKYETPGILTARDCEKDVFGVVRLSEK